MAHIKTTQAEAKKNFLASSVGLIQKTITVSDTGVSADEYGNKIVKAGTILPSNDTNAVGILFEDVDVTAGEHAGAVIIAGHVYKDMLPVAPDTAAVTALKKSGIFFDESFTVERT